ncbi:tRNA (adenosine(37)-N6)-threonylcarbamoyltransferase complex ATPase subunit type 1 TsaE [Echinicola rosea]|uniref:tRNA threonylcarbamoyladenosine biosynthesis protein TsaE n=2 Tax=Echinicola rosea TaxID=1807691 RepID=A0ABQ1UGC5_9BACT|nr:tRNA (adenosine(37)-N6)-threonylcarbamoyltransferase complex ATPase subunit type 1 TsaE [Echinicola rosea]GGF17472.1 tRNA (adenosine(37)-N6)-threonylcarbamoyltransferase complex ATPase subunit type 1 TsaE [Echinicola rosea]
MDLPKAAKEVVAVCKDLPVWIFQGEMGAGKTTLIKAIAKEFGVGDIVSSPSFSIVNEYQNDRGETFYHFDFYRIKEQEEVLEIGVDEYIYSGNYCWLEWAENIPDYLPEEFYLIRISVSENDGREMSIKKF